MASSTINCSGSTYVNKNSAGSNYASATTLYASPLPNNSAFIDQDSCKMAAVLRFDIPASLKYKRFTSARLSFYNIFAGNGDYPTGGQGKLISVTPYITGAVMSDLNYNNLVSSGEIGDKISFYDQSTTAFYLNSWNTVDITSVFINNIYQDEKYTLLLNFLAVDNPSKMYGYGGTYVPYLTVTYEDVTQLPPTPSYPRDVTLREGGQTLFSWTWNSTTPAIQTAVQLEYKLSSAASYTVVNLTQAGHSHIISDLAAGTYLWRIKGTNDASEVSGYSDVVTFTIIGNPAIPVINAPTNKCLTEITWQADGQNAFDITLTNASGTLLLEDSVSSDVSSYKPQMFLANGSYTVGIRVKNSMELWSEFGYKTFTISATAPTAPTLTQVTSGDSVTLTSTIPEGTKIAIMRQEAGEEYKLLAVLEPDVLTFTDDTMKSGVEYKYKSRAYADGYADSDEVTVTVNFDGAILSKGELRLNLKRSSEKYLPYSETSQKEYSAMQFSGREYQMIETSDYHDSTIKRSFHVTKEERKTLEKLLKGCIIYYRDTKDNAFPCALVKVQYNNFMLDGFTVVIDLIRVAEEGVIVSA